MREFAGPADLFTENALRLFEVAQAGAGESSPEESAAGGGWDILIAEDGAIRMVAGAAAAESDWSLDSLRAYHGARMAYRVRRLGTTVRLEGRAGSRTCLFEAGKPDGAARLLLAQNQWLGRAVTPAPLPADTPRLLPASSD